MADRSSPDTLLIRDIVQAAIELACIRHDLCFYDEPPLVVEQCAEIVTDVFNALRGIDTCDPEPCPEFSAILAALEDRQEAAPKSLWEQFLRWCDSRASANAHVISGKDAFMDDMQLDTPPSPERLEYMNHCVRESIAAESRGASRDLGGKHAELANPSNFGAPSKPGVPSEAAPAKCEHDPEDRDSIGCAWCDSKNAAPAPEVQGTPTKEKKVCKYGDTTCPCQDGDACHYEGPNAWNPPAPKIQGTACDLCGMPFSDMVGDDHYCTAVQARRYKERVKK